MIAEVVHSDHVGVGHPRHRLGLALETGTGVRVVDDAPHHHLERHLPLEDRVTSPVHHAHRASADRLHDLVLPDPAAQRLAAGRHRRAGRRLQRYRAGPGRRGWGGLQRRQPSLHVAMLEVLGQDLLVEDGGLVDVGTALVGHAVPVVEVDVLGRDLLRGQHLLQPFDRQPRSVGLDEQLNQQERGLLEALVARRDPLQEGDRVLGLAGVEGRLAAPEGEASLREELDGLGGVADLVVELGGGLVLPGALIRRRRAVLEARA